MILVIGRGVVLRWLCGSIVSAFGLQLILTIFFPLLAHALPCRSGGRVHLAVRQAHRSDPVLSRDPELGERRTRRAIPPDSQHLGPASVRTAGDSGSHHLHPG